MCMCAVNPVYVCHEPYLSSHLKVLGELSKRNLTECQQLMPLCMINRVGGIIHTFTNPSIPVFMYFVCSRTNKSTCMVRKPKLSLHTCVSASPQSRYG